jgi:hypothetical protein
VPDGHRRRCPRYRDTRFAPKPTGKIVRLRLLHRPTAGMPPTSEMAALKTEPRKLELYSSIRTPQNGIGSASTESAQATLRS